MRGFLLTLVVLLYFSVRCHSSSPWYLEKVKMGPDPPKETDCAIRKLALDFATQLVGSSHIDVVYNSLNLSYCDTPLPTKKNFPLPPYQPKQGPVYFISPSGLDTNSGTINSPWKTLQRAQLEIRKTPKNVRDSITVFLREGTYYLSDTFTLTPEDGGNAGKYIVYSNYNNENVTLSAGQSLSLTWKKSAQAGVYEAQVPNGLVFQSLFVNGQRQIRARWPNGLPWLPQDGYAVSSPQQTIATGTATQFINNVVIKDTATGNIIANGAIMPQNESFVFSVTVPENWKSGKPSFSQFVAFYGGTANRFDTTYNYPYFNSAVPQSMYIGPSPINQWSNPNDGIVHVMHTYGWGNWIFTIAGFNSTGNEIQFGRGGFQEARGAPSISQNLYYIENIFEELDNPLEWYLNTTSSILYWYPTADVNPATALVEVGLLPTIVSFLGSRSNPVEYISFRGIRFAHTRPTFLDPYEVPSGGDWSFHRGGAVFVQGAQSIQIADSVFDQPEGNGVFLSNYARNVTIERNLFRFVGDSCVLAVGYTQLMDGYSGSSDQPAYNTIKNNHMHDWGLWGKQTAAFSQSVAHHNLVVGNVMYNAPRSILNVNDGYYGGTIFQNNLSFNAVRETEDHGNFNSWDRQPYLYSATALRGEHSSGKVADLSIVPEFNVIENNFFIRESFISSTHNDWNVDHDDGSSRYLIVNNFLVYGGLKFRDGLDKIAAGNLIVYPNGIQAYGIAFQVNGFHTDAFINNTCVSGTGIFYGYCAGYSDTGPASRFLLAENHYYTPNQDQLPFSNGGCGPAVTSLEQYQKFGYDAGSSQGANFATDQIVSLAKELILFN